MEKIILGKEDNGPGLHFQPVAAATFYKGNIPLRFFEFKAAEMMEKNPWLCGRLKSSQDMGVYLEHPVTVKGQQQVMQGGYLRVIDAPDIDRTGPYTQVSERICALLGVKTGVACVDRPEEPLFQICLLQLKDRNEFAFVLVVSHVIADGHTFYRLYAMFDRDSTVEKLTVQRDLDFAAKKAALIGKEQDSIFTSTSFTTALLISEYLTATPAMQLCSIDLQKIARRKTDYMERMKHHSVESSCDKLPAFISTNDIVTSEIFKLCGGAKAMAVDFRDRLEGITGDMAGNYDSPLWYSSEEDTAPEGIRYSLTTFRPLSSSMPSTWQLLVGGVFGVSSWATFYTDVRLPHQDPLLHLPVLRAADMSVFRQFAFIFHPTKNSLAMIFISRGIDISSFPFGQPLASMQNLPSMP